MLRVNIVGIGPGNPELLTGAARAAIARSNILLGDQRMLAAYAASGKKIHPTIKLAEIAAVAQAADAGRDELAILVSGDVGFFSLAKTISKKLENCECRRYAGISSLVYFAAALGMSWEDAKIVSMHGRQQNLAAAVATHKKVFSLTGGENSPQKLCAGLCEHGLGEVEVYVGENLSYAEEKITHGTASEIAALEFPSLSVMMLLNPAARKRVGAVHGLDDEAFLRSKVPMTKQEVRSVSISKLRPALTDNIYDIGAGTGSCSIELALCAPQGKVWACERNPVAVELLQKNKNLFHVPNLEIVAGEALANIAGLPAPDCVFIGGSGGDLCPMLDLIYEKNPHCRVVINAITLETLAEVIAYYKAHEDYDLEIASVSVARNKNLGRYNLMLAQNPVYVMTAVQKDGSHG